MRVKDDLSREMESRDLSQIRCLDHMTWRTYRDEMANEKSKVKEEVSARRRCGVEMSRRLGRPREVKSLFNCATAAAMPDLLLT